MPLEVTVGPPQLVIHHGQTVWAADPDGQLTPNSKLGLLFLDTRLISGWRLFANGMPWKLLNGGAVTHFAARVFLTNPAIPTQEGEIGEHTLSLVLGRWIDGGVHEDLDLANHGMVPIRFNLELAIRCDFADVFEVKADRMVRRGQITTEWAQQDQTLRTTYRNRDFLRAVHLKAQCEGDAAVYANGRISFDITLAPGASWHGCLLYDLVDNGSTYTVPQGCHGTAMDSRPGRSLVAWRQQATKLRTSNEEFYRTYAQAVDDMAALRLPIEHAGQTHVVPAAGLPWFTCLFGRDSLIVAMQSLPVSPEFARGALALLAAWQAQEVDDYRDAEPGKILHELRKGELAHFKLIPHTPYYGTADATPLYLMLLHETWRWTGDRAFIEALLPTAEGCLSWIDKYGDRDGDGFQEYQTRSPQGYENMAWKDSGDAVLYEDGSMVKGPKALCELQGYVFAAWTGMAEIYDAFGQPDRARELRRRAGVLFDRFNEAFWDEELGFYAYGLDGDKRRVRSIASNVGHCLWTGIVRPDRAPRVVERLMAPDMFSGYGIRTLSAKHAAFNPYSYHDGSVWPHDNGLIALGLRRYGFAAEAARVARAISGAASFFALHQVPELFAGIQRESSPFPVQFLGSNVPQAWAAGSAFSFLSAMLGLQPDAANSRLVVDPALPGWLPDVELHEVQVGETMLNLRFWSADGTPRCEVINQPASAVVVVGPTGNRMA
jgi:glycogen debranching enzyme